MSNINIKYEAIDGCQFDTKAEAEEWNELPRVWIVENSFQAYTKCFISKEQADLYYQSAMDGNDYFVRPNRPKPLIVDTTLSSQSVQSKITNTESKKPSWIDSLRGLVGI